MSTATGPGWVSSRLTLPTAPLIPSSAVGRVITQLEAEVDLHRRYGSGYQRIALEPSSVAGSDEAARWEFLLERPEGIQHKLDLGAVCGGKGYGLLVEAPTEEWSKYETQLSGVLESFECL